MKTRDAKLAEQVPNHAASSEAREQSKVMEWANIVQHQIPELRWLFHIPNGGRRDIAEAAHLKRMGVKSGVSDLFLPCSRMGYHGLFIEMKYGDNKLSDNQKAFFEAMRGNGYKCEVAYSAEEAIQIIRIYLKGET